MAKHRRFSTSRMLPHVSFMPLINTILILFMIFMVAQVGMLRLLTLRDDQSDKRFRVVHVAISDTHTLRIDGTPVKFTNVKAHIQRTLARSPIKTVLLEAGVQIPSSTLHTIVDTIRSIEGADLVIKKQNVR